MTNKSRQQIAVYVWISSILSMLVAFIQALRVKSTPQHKQRTSFVANKSNMCRICVRHPTTIIIIKSWETVCFVSWQDIHTFAFLICIRMFVTTSFLGILNRFLPCFHVVWHTVRLCLCYFGWKFVLANSSVPEAEKLSNIVEQALLMCFRANVFVCVCS